MAYIIDTEEFSTFERRLNDVVMGVHEAVDNPLAVIQTQKPATPSGGWKNKVSGAMNAFRAKGPMKLFTCMSSDEPEKPGLRTEQRPAPTIKRRASHDVRPRH